jgi:hypothetical protein
MVNLISNYTIVIRHMKIEPNFNQSRKDFICKSVVSKLKAFIITLLLLNQISIKLVHSGFVRVVILTSVKTIEIISFYIKTL